MPSHRRAVHRAAAAAASLTLLLAAAAGCASGGSSRPEASAVTAGPAGQWTAVLEDVGGSGVRGSALITAAGNSAETSATVQVSGGTPNATYPWHLHTGRCGEAGGQIVGQPQAYTPVAVGADGSGRVRVTVPVAVPTSGALRVQVHRSAADMGTIVSCGNLAPM